MSYKKNFELFRTEDMHLAAAMMTQGFLLHGCEGNDEGRWVRFVLLVPDDRADEVEKLAQATRSAWDGEDIPIPFGAYRRALSELRSVLRQAKGRKDHESGERAAGAAGN